MPNERTNVVPTIWSPSNATSVRSGSTTIRSIRSISSGGQVELKARSTTAPNAASSESSIGRMG
jgi:hypothetical protein